MDQAVTIGANANYPIRDEDDMASDDAYSLATQQSIKAYADSLTTASASSTQTLTNKSIDGDTNTLSDIAYSSIKSTSRSGSDATLVTGTAGTDTYSAAWNADGDVVDGPGVAMGFIGSDDALTVDNDLNIAGLSSTIALANSIKSTMNTHYADATEHTSGVQTAVSTADATDLASILALTGAMLTSYAAHDDDAILAAAWAYHVAQGTERALASEVAPTTLTEAIARLNDLKAKLNLHMADGVSHTVGDTPAVATADSAMGAAVNHVVTGAATGDLITWGILDGGTGTVTGVSAVPGTDNVVFTFSADPQADTIISYMIVRTP